MPIGIILKVSLTIAEAGHSRLTAIIQWLIICSREILFTEMPLREFPVTVTVASERVIPSTTAVQAVVTAVIYVRDLCVLTVVVNVSAAILSLAVEVV